jgi:hypothetical protein
MLQRAPDNNAIVSGPPAGSERLAFKKSARICRVFVLLSLFSFCFHASADDRITIKLANQTDSEKSAQQQLLRILREYDLSRWTFTRSVVIDENAIPHSHPVLTLHTRHRKDDELLLSTYVHEQLHWFIAQHKTEADAALGELRGIYPNIPVGFPEGSSDEGGNYEHLLVIYLEYRADQTLMGELKARQVMNFWSEDHYTWLYRKVLSDPETVGRIAKANGLVPK